METKQEIHNLIILDESGSMNLIKDFIMQGFNEIVQNLKGLEEKFSEQEHFVTFLTFNGLRTNLVHFVEPVRELKELDKNSYQPNASTPLYDAMGYGLNLLRKKLLNKENCNVIVTILTDGEENASTEYTRESINSLVNELKREDWSFTYIGADHDVIRVARSLSIDDFMVFEKKKDNVENMFNIRKDVLYKTCNKIHINTKNKPR